MSRQYIIHRHSSVTNKIPDTQAMEYGELFVNYASGTGKSFISTKKSDDTIAEFAERAYCDNAYGSKSVVDDLNTNCVKSAVTDTTITTPRIVNNTLSIPYINMSQITGAVSSSLSDLDGSATIASKNGNTITLKASVVETDGIIGNGTQTDIVLSDVASTGDGSDVTLTYNGNSSNVQSAINNIDSRLASLEATPTINTVICSANAAEIPSGATYSDGGTTVVGTMAASNATMGIIYLVKSGSSYIQWITTRSGSAGNYTYSWVNLGSTSVDLSGYLKTISLNGSSYTASNGSTTVTLPNVITSVVGESAISSGVSDYVSVVATDGAAASGSKTVTLTSSVKTHAISNATAQSNGLATAKDVKDYVEGNLTTFKTWTESDIINS